MKVERRYEDDRGGRMDRYDLQNSKRETIKEKTVKDKPIQEDWWWRHHVRGEEELPRT
jgi:hypothetical protein